MTATMIIIIVRPTQAVIEFEVYVNYMMFLLYASYIKNFYVWCIEQKTISIISITSIIIYA